MLGVTKAFLVNIKGAALFKVYAFMAALMGEAIITASQKERENRLVCFLVLFFFSNLSLSSLALRS